jgi:hypothetical protein
MVCRETSSFVVQYAFEDLAEAAEAARDRVITVAPGEA